MYLLQTIDNRYLKANGQTTDDRSVAKVFRTLKQAVAYCTQYVQAGGSYIFPRKYDDVPANNPVKPDLKVVEPAKRKTYRDKFESMKMSELRAWCKARMSPETIRGWGEGSLRRKETYIRAAWLWYNTHARQADATHMIAAA